MNSNDLNNLVAKLLPQGMLARSIEMRFAVGEEPTYKVTARIADSHAEDYADFFGKIYLKADPPITPLIESNEQNR